MAGEGEAGKKRASGGPNQYCNIAIVFIVSNKRKVLMQLSKVKICCRGVQKKKRDAVEKKTHRHTPTNSSFLQNFSILLLTVCSVVVVVVLLPVIIKSLF